MVSNEMAFNLLCGEILPSSAQTVQSNLSKVQRNALFKQHRCACNHIKFEASKFSKF
jgi:hypothetical protein